MGGPVFMDNRYVDELDNWCTVYLVGKDRNEYSSVEHYYQSKKCVINEERENIICAKTAREAHKLGRKCLLRQDWLEIRNEVMFEGNLLKIQQYQNLKELLIHSKGDIIYPGDNLYWCGNIFNRNKGRNTFGIILMTIRSLLRNDKDNFKKYCDFLNIKSEKYL
jgi:ribA/ribD-fused uncharacterized protein